MKSKYVHMLAAASLFAMPAITSASYAAAPVATAAQTEAQKLAALFAEDDEATLKRNPLNALFRGDMRYADRLGDYISDAYFDAECPQYIVDPHLVQVVAAISEPVIK